ncbi:MAG: SRPBCC family protein [Planctomycetaceae bacterium]|nr:SRPBCC family protein [Planctomycetaceae bacterium]
MKTTLAVIAGVIAAGIVISLLEYAGHQMFPLPADIDTTSIEDIKANAHRIPAAAQLVVCLAWALGTLAGSFTATKILTPRTRSEWSPVRPALITAAILAGAALVNLLTIPSPVWMWIVGLSVFLPSGLIGWRLAADVSTLLIEQHSDASPAEVFALAADFPNAANHVSGITRVEMLTPGDPGVGTRFRETRIMFGREAVEEMEVTDFQPNHSYTIEANSCGSHFRTRLTTSPAENGTQITMETTITPTTLFAKLMSPMAALMAAPLKKCLTEDLSDLASAASAASRG